MLNFRNYTPKKAQYNFQEIAPLKSEVKFSRRGGLKNYISMIIICINKHNAQHNKQMHVQKIDLNPIITGGVKKTFRSTIDKNSVFSLFMHSQKWLYNGPFRGYSKVHNVIHILTTRKCVSKIVLC